MNLYDISGKLTFLLEKGQAGELTEEDQIELDNLEMKRSIKLENYAKVIRTLEATAVAYKAEELRLREKRERTEKNIAWLKRSVLSDLYRHNESKVSAGVFNFTRVQYAPKLTVTDEERIPSEFVVVKTEERISKQLINDHFKETGEIIPGTELTTTESLRLK